MRLFKKTHIDFLGKRGMWYMISSAMVLVGLVSMMFKGISLGIDFQGGTEISMSFSERVDIGEVRAALDKVGLGKAEIKTYGGESNLLIRSTEQAEGTTIGNRIKAALQAQFPTKTFEVHKEDKIGPKIGKELRRDALYAVMWSILAILIYIALRYKFTYGLGGIMSLVHDVFTTFGFLSILHGVVPRLNLDLSQEIIAAFLTMIGVSMNDTVVIFDRIRENKKIYKTMALHEVMNKSINDTLSRTIITHGTILMVLMVLLFFGGEVNRGFAFVMAFGIFTGTYSSIYVASAFVLDWSLLRKKKV